MIGAVGDVQVMVLYDVHFTVVTVGQLLAVISEINDRISHYLWIKGLIIILINSYINYKSIIRYLKLCYH